jgi:hypothetical protein
VVLASIMTSVFHIAKARIRDDEIQYPTAFRFHATDTPTALTWETRMASEFIASQHLAMDEVGLAGVAQKRVPSFAQSRVIQSKARQVWFPVNR